MIASSLGGQKREKKKLKSGRKEGLWPWGGGGGGFIQLFTREGGGTSHKKSNPEGNRNRRLGEGHKTEHKETRKKKNTRRQGRGKVSESKCGEIGSNKKR